jgi:hypothetical protein
MAFKAGMHQPINDYDVDFAAVIAKMSQVEPRKSYPLVGWGKKSYIEASIKKKAGNRIVFEVFAETTFNTAPVDPELGYTKDEAQMFKGVTITNNEEQPNTTGHQSSMGEMLEYTDFVNRFIVDETSRVTLGLIFDNMEQQMRVSDEMLDRVNKAWTSRATNAQELFYVPYH